LQRRAWGAEQGKVEGDTRRKGPPANTVVQGRRPVDHIHQGQTGTGAHQIAGDGEIGAGKGALRGHAGFRERVIQLTVDVVVAGNSDHIPSGHQLWRQTRMGRQGIVGPQDAHAGKLKGLHVKARAGNRRVDKPDVDLAPTHPVGNLRAAAHLEVQFDPGMVPLKLGKNPWQEVDRGGTVAGDADAAHGTGPDLQGPLCHPLHRHQGLLRLVMQQQSLAGGREVSLRAVEKAKAQFLFKTRQCNTHRRLR